ncbi:MAG TPA: response regulator transcription factor [Desulfuromonadaceae bacterium]|nr:response regulator transcription factor [Desulfuromonadaceae bacterium]
MEKIKILLCDDHAMVRAGLRLLLETAADIEVVGEAADGHRAVREAKRLLPDIVLMDLSMPLLNGIEATRQLLKEFPLAKVLILSAHNDDQYVQHAMKAGAVGYLVKESAESDLLRAVREIAAGNAFFSPAIARRMLGQSRERFFNNLVKRAVALTSRQAEVLQLIAEGYSTKQMGDVLSLSGKTVEKHRQGLMARLNIHNVATLTRYAVSHGVVELKL